MEIARRAAAAVRPDDDYRLPDHSLPHGRMSVDALRRELVKESILQEIILAELGERRELGPEVRRELGLEARPATSKQQERLGFAAARRQPASLSKV